MSLLVDVLACYRLTRLVTTDHLTEPARDHLIEAFRVAGMDRMVYAMRCDWCTGMWVAFGVVAARRVAPRAWDPIARVLAFSAVTGIVATNV